MVGRNSSFTIGLITLIHRLDELLVDTGSCEAELTFTVLEMKHEVAGAVTIKVISAAVQIGRLARLQVTFGAFNTQDQPVPTAL